MVHQTSGKATGQQGGGQTPDREGEDTTPAVQMDHQPQEQEEASPQGPRQSSRQKKRPERLGTAASEEQLKQLSPRQRRRRQSQAKFGLMKTFIREAGQWKVG